MKKETLTVMLDDGRYATFTAGEDYTEYDVRNGLFILIYENQWVAFYNLSHVLCMEVSKQEVEE